MKSSQSDDSSKSPPSTSTLSTERSQQFKIESYGQPPVSIEYAEEINYLRYDASGVLTPHTGKMEKHCASIMIGLIDACRLSACGWKVLPEGIAGPDTKPLN